MLRALRRCQRDDRGQVLTEYALVTMFVAIPCMALVQPDNGIYGAMREFYEYIQLTMYMVGP
ncbi:MAG: hypothetical protein O2901_16265 [Verrucomicrobia bacterium]|nr:hypothetical protein [Verrucomicrobiota bacterium]